MTETSLKVGDLVDIGVQMVVQFGHGQPVKFTLRARVALVIEEGIEVRLLDQIPALNNYPLRVPAEAVALILSKAKEPSL